MGSGSIGGQAADGLISTLPFHCALGYNSRLKRVPARIPMTRSENFNFTELTLAGISGDIAALAVGDRSNPPVLALHGWLDNAATFQRLMPLLNHYYIVALDFAGHGRSAHRPVGTKYHMADYIADVAHAIKDLGWQKFRIMGHSLGAGVGMVYAALFNSRVQQLVMIDGLGPTTSPAVDASQRLRKSIQAGLEAAKNADAVARVYDSWSKLIDARRRASPVSEPGAELLLSRGTSKVEGGYIVNSDQRLKHPSAVYLSEEVVLHLISEVRCQSLLILANDGMVAERTFTQGRIAAFSDLTVKYLDGQHHLHLDVPQQVAEEINLFFASVN